MAIQKFLSSRRARAAAMIFTAAFAVRAVYTLATSAGPAEIVADARDYSSYAESLLDRGQYRNVNDARAERVPGYPLLLAGIYAVAGRAVWPVQFVQCLIGAGTCVLVFLLLADWIDERWGMAGGLGAACYYDLFATSARVLTETAATFLLTLTFYLWSRRRPVGSRAAALLGLAAAALSLIRPEFTIFTALLAGLVMADNWRASKPRALASAATVCIASGLMFAPWIARNQRALGEPIVTSTSGPVNLYLGIPRTVHDRFAELNAFIPIEQLPRMAELESRDFFRRRTLELYRLLNFRQIARALVFNTLIQYYPFLPQYDATLVFWLPFWLWGVWLCRRDRRFWPPLAALVYLTCLYDVVAVMQARHRQVLASAAILLGIFGLRALSRTLSPRAFRRALAGWATVNVFIWALAPRVREAALFLRDRL